MSSSGTKVEKRCLKTVKGLQFPKIKVSSAVTRPTVCAQFTSAAPGYLHGIRRAGGMKANLKCMFSAVQCNKVLCLWPRNLTISSSIYYIDNWHKLPSRIMFPSLQSSYQLYIQDKFSCYEYNDEWLLCPCSNGVCIL